MKLNSQPTMSDPMLNDEIHIKKSIKKITQKNNSSQPGLQK